MTTTPLAAAAIAKLEAEGVDAVIGTVINPAGLTLAKTVPIRRTHAFADPGLGASPVWHAFAIDQTGIAFTDHNGVVGDQRIRIDLSALRILGDGLAWAPGSFLEQDGSRVPECSRGTLQRIETALAEVGTDAMVGHEIEFLLVQPDGHRLPSTAWAQYGLAGVLEHEAFIRDVIVTASLSGIATNRCTPNSGPISSRYLLRRKSGRFRRPADRHQNHRQPDSPALRHADQFLAGAVCRRRWMRCASTLFVDQCGRTTVLRRCGARGMTSEGESAVAGLLRGLPEAQGMLCGSIVSGLRLHPGNWAGTYVCWGTENREAALRFVVGGPGNPYGGNVEVKPVDPSANPYFATAAILGLALDGITDNAVLPAEVKVDPAALSDAERHRAGIASLSTSQAQTIAALDDSQRMRLILGDPAVDATVAVRRFEHEHYAHLNREQLADKFRMAWSV